MEQSVDALNVLSALITPAVLISACGSLVISTSTRLARIVDRVRELGGAIEDMAKSEEGIDFLEDRRAEVERQIYIHARRSRLIQSSLTSFYISLSVFVAATVAIGVSWLFQQTFQRALWVPNILAVIGTVVLFYGCVMLIAETRLALRSVNSEMEFTLRLREKYKQQRAAAEAEVEDAIESERGVIKSGTRIHPRP